MAKFDKNSFLISDKTFLELPVKHLGNELRYKGHEIYTGKKKIGLRTVKLIRKENAEDEQSLLF